ncbi:WD domain, G-beta repeat-containing protein [Toxoplasma gondii GT1]|uniref:Autophagy-related protein 16L n=2 Tax=Toxoplasma gondii TaxID=5811 RepID=A16L1_TOXGO|nr:WD domain, G-beta repeat-containing protein [Toxoplasma gondii GT1]KAF4642501.1 WD domain, G-beta repeat-containing protein [Toxoplasma gondii]
MRPAACVASGPSPARVASLPRPTRRSGCHGSFLLGASGDFRAHSGDTAVDIPVWQYVFLRRAAVRDRIQSRWFQDLLLSYSLVMEENVHLLAENASALTSFAANFPAAAGERTAHGSFSRHRHDGLEAEFSGLVHGQVSDNFASGSRSAGETQKPGICEPSVEAAVGKSGKPCTETKSGDVDSTRAVIGALRAQLGETSRRLVAAEESIVSVNEKLEQTRKMLEEKTIEGDVLRRLVGEREEELGDRETELAEAKKACAFLQNERNQLQQALQTAQQEVMEKALENERYLRELLRYKEAEATRLNEMQQLYVSIMEKQQKIYQPETEGRGDGEGEGARGSVVLAGLDIFEKNSGQPDPKDFRKSSRRGRESLFLQLSTQTEASACSEVERTELVACNNSSDKGGDGRGSGSHGQGTVVNNSLAQRLSFSSGWRRAKAQAPAAHGVSGERTSVSASQLSAASSRGRSDSSVPTTKQVVPSSSASVLGTSLTGREVGTPEQSATRGDMPARQSAPSYSTRTSSNGVQDHHRRSLDVCRPPTRVQKSLLAHRGSVHACCAVPRMWGADIWTSPRSPSLPDDECGFAHHELLLTCGEDGFLALVDATSPALLYSFVVSPSKAPLLCVDTANEHRIALVAAGDVTLYTVNACSQRVTSTLKGHSGRITACGFIRSAASGFWHQLSGSGAATGDADTLMTGAGGPSSASVWSCSLDRTVRLWDARRSACVKTTSLDSAITMGTASPDGEWLATSHQNGSLSVLNVRAEKCERVASLQLHEEAATGVAFDPSGRLLATQGKDKQLKVVDIRMWKEVMTLLHIEMRYNIVQASPVFSRGDGAFVAAAAGPHVYCWTIRGKRSNEDGRIASGECYGSESYWGELEKPEGTPRGCEGGRAGGMQYTRRQNVWRDAATEAQPDVVLRSQMTDVTCLSWQLHRGLVTGGKDGSVMLWEHA